MFLARIARCSVVGFFLSLVIFWPFVFVKISKNQFTKSLTNYISNNVVKIPFTIYRYNTYVTTNQSLYTRNNTRSLYTFDPPLNPQVLFFRRLSNKQSSVCKKKKKSPSGQTILNEQNAQFRNKRRGRKGRSEAKSAISFFSVRSFLGHFLLSGRRPDTSSPRRPRSSIFAAYDEQRKLGSGQWGRRSHGKLWKSKERGTKADLTGTGAEKPLRNNHETSSRILFNVRREKERKTGGRKRRTPDLSASNPFVKEISPFVHSLILFCSSGEILTSNLYASTANVNTEEIARGEAFSSPLMAWASSRWIVIFGMSSRVILLFYNTLRVRKCESLYTECLKKKKKKTNCGQTWGVMFIKTREKGINCLSFRETILFTRIGTIFTLVHKKYLLSKQRVDILNINFCPLTFVPRKSAKFFFKYILFQYKCKY